MPTVAASESRLLSAIAAVMPRGARYSVSESVFSVEVSVHALPASVPLRSPEEIAWWASHARYEIPDLPAGSAELRALCDAVRAAVRKVANKGCFVGPDARLSWADVPEAAKVWTGSMYVWRDGAPTVVPCEMPA